MLVYHQVHDYIIANKLFHPHDRVLAAVSGGADSLCLVDCLLEEGVEVAIAHFDHQLRPESPVEAEIVRAFAENRKCAFQLGRGEAYSLSCESGSLEEAARLARYRFLADAARAAGCTLIATGHHADDQVETILLHLIRGSGVEGLAGMRPTAQMEAVFSVSWAQELKIVRPLLSLTRSAIETHCVQRGIEPVIDPSNAELLFLRNRIRHELIPLLKEFNTGVQPVLLRMAEIMRGTYDWMERWLEVRRDEILEMRDDGCYVHIQPFQALPDALQPVLIKHALQMASAPGADIGFTSIQRLCAALLEPGRRRVSLPGSMEARLLGSSFRIAFVNTPLSLQNFPSLEREEMELSIPGETKLSPGWMIRASEFALDRVSDEGIFAACTEREIVMDADSFAHSPRLRCSLPGDRFQPFGLLGSMKLSDFFINEKIPLEARNQWPLLVSGSRILWVVGLRASEACRITDHSKQAVKLKLLIDEGGPE